MQLVNKIEWTISNAVQDMASIIIEIRMIIKASRVQFIIKYTKGYPKYYETFEDNPGVFLIRKCDQEAR